MPFNFDIDRYLNRIVPRPRLYALPYPVARFLGYRRSPDSRKIKDATAWGWAFLGAFVGVIAVEQTFLHIGGRLGELGVPMIVGSFGATAILVYNSIDAPLSQPRNVIFGQLLSAFIGVAVTKLFMLNENFDDLVWLAAALCCGISSAVMGITKTVHPPAGATALLAASEASVRTLGWWYIPVVLLSSAIMMGVALLFNNVQRRYPNYWWTPLSLEKPKPETDEDIIEKQPSNISNGSGRTAVPDSELVITHGVITIPEWLQGSLGQEQLLVLEEIQCLLREEKFGLKRGESESRVTTQHGSHNTLIDSDSKGSQLSKG